MCILWLLSCIFSHQLCASVDGADLGDNGRKMSCPDPTVGRAYDLHPTESMHLETERTRRWVTCCEWTGTTPRSRSVGSLRSCSLGLSIPSAFPFQRCWSPCSFPSLPKCATARVIFPDDPSLTSPFSPISFIGAYTHAHSSPLQLM